MDTKTIKNILIIFLIIVIFYLMSALSSILIPLVLALLAALIFSPVINILVKMHFPKFIILPIIACITLGFAYLIGEVIYTTSLDIIADKDFLAKRFNERLADILHFYNSITGSRYRPRTFFTEIYKAMDKDAITGIIRQFAGSVTSFSGDFFMFSLYYVILLAGIPNSKRYFRFVGGEKGDELLANYENIQKSVVSYILLKASINLLLGAGIYLICSFFGVKFALFWGFLMFIFHFVPSIGAIIASIPPVLMAALQFDNWGVVAIVAGLITGLQFLVGNMIEPKIMGTRLKINTLTVLFGLVFWGYIWGIAGMLLSVPMLVIMRLILEKIPDLSFLARVMGSPGKTDANPAETNAVSKLEEQIEKSNTNE